jgi:hypothetical protein
MPSEPRRCAPAYAVLAALRPASCSSSQVAALAHDLDILGHPEGDDKEFQDYAKYALSRKMTGNGNT